MSAHAVGSKCKSTEERVQKPPIERKLNRIFGLFIGEGKGKVDGSRLGCSLSLSEFRSEQREGLRASLK